MRLLELLYKKIIYEKWLVLLAVISSIVILLAGFSLVGVAVNSSESVNKTRLGAIKNAGETEQKNRNLLFSKFKSYSLIPVFLAEASSQNYLMSGVSEKFIKYENFIQSIKAYSGSEILIIPFRIEKAQIRNVNCLVETVYRPFSVGQQSNLNSSTYELNMPGNFSLSNESFEHYLNSFVLGRDLETVFKLVENDYLSVHNKNLRLKAIAGETFSPDDKKILIFSDNYQHLSGFRFVPVVEDSKISDFSQALESSKNDLKKIFDSWSLVSADKFYAAYDFMEKGSENASSVVTSKDDDATYRFEFVFIAGCLSAVVYILIFSFFLKSRRKRDAASRVVLRFSGLGGAGIAFLAVSPVLVGTVVGTIISFVAMLFSQESKSMVTAAAIYRIVFFAVFAFFFVFIVLIEKFVSKKIYTGDRIQVVFSGMEDF